jgi:trigger factor
MPEGRPDIPSPMKREIRQRCGFGCVICGKLLFTYEHLEGWANVERHVASEITLLCDHHQRERTNGLLPLQDVREADKNPYNKRTSVSPAYQLHYSGATCAIVIGGNVCKRDRLRDGDRLIAIMVDRQPILGFTFDQGRLLLMLELFNDQGERTLWIEENELRLCPSPWDVEFEGRRFTVREGRAEFHLDIEFAPPDKIEIQRGRLSMNGFEVIIRPDRICFANDMVIHQRCEAYGSDVAMWVSDQDDPTIRASFKAFSRNRGKVNRDAVEKWLRSLER